MPSLSVHLPSVRHAGRSAHVDARADGGFAVEDDGEWFELDGATGATVAVVVVGALVVGAGPQAATPESPIHHPMTHVRIAVIVARSTAR